MCSDPSKTLCSLCWSSLSSVLQKFSGNYACDKCASSLRLLPLSPVSLLPMLWWVRGNQKSALWRLLTPFAFMWVSRTSSLSSPSYTLYSQRCLTSLVLLLDCFYFYVLLSIEEMWTVKHTTLDKHFQWNIRVLFCCPKMKRTSNEPANKLDYKSSMNWKRERLY